MKRLIQCCMVPSTDRGDYSYQRYVQNNSNVPFNFLRIEVGGRHDTRRVLAGIRNYYVASGSGCFTIENEGYEVMAGALITILPGQTYSYQGKMGLLEFNVDTGDGIAHEDLE